MRKTEFWNVVLFDPQQRVYTVFGHNMSGVEAEDAVNELREQRIPALSGKQVGEHGGSHEDCKNCEAMKQIMAEKIKPPRQPVRPPRREVHSRETYSQEGE